MNFSEEERGGDKVSALGYLRHVSKLFPQVEELSIHSNIYTKIRKKPALFEALMDGLAETTNLRKLITAIPRNAWTRSVQQLIEQNPNLAILDLTVSKGLPMNDSDCDSDDPSYADAQKSTGIGLLALADALTNRGWVDPTTSTMHTNPFAEIYLRGVEDEINHLGVDEDDGVAVDGNYFVVDNAKYVNSILASKNCSCHVSLNGFVW